MPPILRLASRPINGRVPGYVRALAAPVLTLGLIWAMRDRLLSIDLTEIGHELGAIPAHAWILALVLSAGSYWALGRFDAIAHRIFRTGVGLRLARRAGMASMALSQTLGFGVLSGAVARWRLIPELSLPRALMVSGFMAAGFMAVWAWLTTASLMVHPEMTPGAATAARLGFCTATVLAATIFLWPAGIPRLIRRRLRAAGIGMRSIAAMVLYATLDLIAAAAIVYVLAGADGPALHLLVPAFLLSLGAGLLSGMPGGLGAFELTLLSLLPNADPTALMVAITGYRLVYFAVPAAISAVALAFPELIRPSRASPNLEWRKGADLSSNNSELSRALYEAPLAEAHLARQPGLGLIWSSTRAAGAVIGEAGHSLVMIRDAFPTSEAADVANEFLALSRHRGLSPCFYKCGARQAVFARRRGFEVMQIAREAWLEPAEYDVGTRERRQLRRKLRHAEKAGIVFVRADPQHLPLAAMSEINQDWAEMHDGERGFSMGRFHPSLIAQQRVYLAWRGDELRGFVSFHTGRGEWTLDLMRPAKDATDGTAHGLLHAALLDAAAEGLPRLSLAAAPFQGHEDVDIAKEGPLVRLRQRLAGRTGGLGLARFKAMFDPKWEPLYIAAPSRWHLLRSGAEIARAIAHPTPLPGEK